MVGPEETKPEAVVGAPVIQKKPCNVGRRAARDISAKRSRVLGAPMTVGAKRDRARQQARARKPKHEDLLLQLRCSFKQDRTPAQRNAARRQRRFLATGQGYLTKADRVAVAKVIGRRPDIARVPVRHAMTFAATIPALRAFFRPPVLVRSASHRLPRAWKQKRAVLWAARRKAKEEASAA